MILKKELNMNKQIFKTFHIRTRLKQFLRDKGIRGCKKTALNGKTKFLVEMHSSNLLSMEENSERVIKWAKSINHKILYLAKMKFINDSKPIKNRGRCHLLLVPENFTINNRLKSIKQGETSLNLV